MNESIQRGSITLWLSIILFIVSLTAAGWVSWLLWQERHMPQPELPSAVTPQDDTALTVALQPDFSIDPDLEENREQLEQRLLRPLRDFYATKVESLGTVSIILSEDVEHSTEVKYQLLHNGEVQTVEFFYDREGEAKDGPFPRWELSLLDNTN